MYIYIYRNIYYIVWKLVFLPFLIDIFPRLHSFFVLLHIVKTTMSTTHEKCLDFLEKARKNEKNMKLLKFLNADSETTLKLICKKCGLKGIEKSARAFFSSDGTNHSVTMCENRLRSQTAFNQTLKHEMIHAVDYCKRDMNFIDCDMLACSEIRAATHAECENFPNFLNFNFGPKFSCVVETAKRATTAGHCKEEGEDCVDKMMDKCFVSIFTKTLFTLIISKTRF